MSSLTAFEGRPAKSSLRWDADVVSALELGWYDFITTYRRSFFGPLWLPLQMLAFIAIITLILGRTFENDQGRYALYVALGMLAWELISSALMEGPRLFTMKAGLIKSVPMKLSSLTLRKLSYLLCRFSFAVPVAVLFLVVFGGPLTLNALWVIPAFPVLILNAYFFLTILGFLGVYFRDIYFLMQTALRFLFFMTPIFWYGGSGARAIISTYNPFSYFLEIVRSPLMGEAPTVTAWAVVLTISIIGAIFTRVVETRLKRAIVFWL